MAIELRIEEAGDFGETETVVREAFWNHFSPGCDEHYLLHIMRDCPAFVRELDFVAVENGRIVGNIVYAKTEIVGDGGERCEVLCLGPVAVLPEYQRKGVGSRLIEHTKNLAREMGFRAVLLYGDPDYYDRNGFIPAEQLGIRTADNMYADALQVCVLYKNALQNIKGRFFEGEIYEVDAGAAAEFDKHFPVKEKISGTPTQMRFQELVVMRRSAT